MLKTVNELEVSDIENATRKCQPAEPHHTRASRSKNLEGNWQKPQK
jgi:hypothetical protein